MTKRRSAPDEEGFWPEQRAAIAEYEEKQRNAWKSVSEFDNVLHLAISSGELKPLRDYVAAGKPIPDVTANVAGQTRPMKTLVADLLGSQALPQPAGRGRSSRVPSKAPPMEQAERNAAWYVAMLQAGWRRHHGRRRVPPVETKKMIRAAIKEAAAAFKVPAGTISASNIEALLKSGRIVVRN